MKTLIRIALLVSLLANLLGVALLARRRTPEPNASRSAERPAIAVPQATTAVAVAGPEGVGVAADRRTPATRLDPLTADFRTLRTWLEAEGIPGEVIRIIVERIALERHGLFQAGKGPSADPADRTWRMDASKAAGLEVKDAVGLFAFEEEELRRGFALHYADLPRATAETLRELEGEYSNKSDQEMTPALAALLTPAQLEDYQRYNSLLARNIQFVLSTLDVEQSEYEALWNATVAREQTTAPVLTMREQTEHNTTPQAAEDYRRILGDERFLEIITRFDSASARVDGIYQVAGLTAARRADLFMEAFRTKYAEKLRNDETLPAVRTAGMGSELASAERERTIRVAENLQRSLIDRAGLTPEQAKAFEAIFLQVPLDQMKRVQGFGYRLSVQPSPSPSRGW